jgi:hypothetical protein
MPGTRWATIALALGCFLGPWSQARGTEALRQKIDRIQNQTAQARARWQATKSALRSLQRNKPLRAALGAKSDAIVLGERSGAYNVHSPAYSKSLHWGLSEFTGTMAVKVKWKKQLVLDRKGLRVRSLRSVSKPTKASVEAFQSALDAQFAKKPDRIKMPDTKVEYEPYTDFRVTGSKRGRLSWIGLFSTRIKASEWGHVTPTQIEGALQSWSQAPAGSN